MSTLAELGRTHELLWNLTCASCVLATTQCSRLGLVIGEPVGHDAHLLVRLRDAARVDGSSWQSQRSPGVRAVHPLRDSSVELHVSVGVGTSMGSVLGNGGLVKKVAFPREHLVLATVAASLVTLLIEIAVLSVVLAFFGNIVILELPGVVLAAALLTMFVVGLSLFMSAANVFFRDMNHLWGILLQIWFFLTPVVYPPELVEDKLPTWAFWIYEHLPMAVAVRLFRTLLYDVRYPTVLQFGYLAIWGVLTLLGRLGSLQEAGTSIRGGAVSGDAVDGGPRRATSR